MTLRLQPIRVQTARDWYLEAGFGRVTGPACPACPDLDTALARIAQHLRAPY